MSEEKKQKQEEAKETADVVACSDCEKLRAECAEYKAGWQRALADYKNFQTEVEKRRAEWADYSKQMILEEFIPVYDNLKLAAKETRNNNQETNNSDPWVEGIKHIMKQYADILKNNGVEEISAKGGSASGGKTTGDKFDPKFHEAVGEETIEGTEPGTIIREIAGGYKMGGRVIRAAKVIVSK